MIKSFFFFFFIIIFNIFLSVGLFIIILLLLLLLLLCNAYSREPPRAARDNLFKSVLDNIPSFVRTVYFKRN